MGLASPIRVLVREHRKQLMLTYTLFGLEMLASLLRPYLVGVAVDGLIAGSYRGLVELSIAHLLYLVIGTARHMYDTRTFSAIYTTFVTRLLAQPAGAEELSRRSALSTLARQVTDFVEFDVNCVVEGFYNSVGSLVLLFVYDHEVVMICLVILAAVAVLGRGYGIRASRLNKEQFDELEQQVDIIAGQDPVAMKKHYRRFCGFLGRGSPLAGEKFLAAKLLPFFSLCGAPFLPSPQPGGPTPAGRRLAPS